MVHADEVSQDGLPIITKQVAARLRRLAGKKELVPSGQTFDWVIRSLIGC
jgi:hypothetical protein